MKKTQRQCEPELAYLLHIGKGKETETYIPQVFNVGILHLKYQNPLNKKSI